MPLCPASVGTGRQGEVYTAEFGFAGALVGFWDFLTSVAELPALQLLKVLLAAKEAWGPAFTDPWSYGMRNILPAHLTLTWEDFSFQTDSDMLQMLQKTNPSDRGYLSCLIKQSIFRLYPGDSTLGPCRLCYLLWEMDPNTAQPRWKYQFLLFALPVGEHANARAE